MTAPPLPVVGVDLSLTATGVATEAGVQTITSSGKAGASLRVRRARLNEIALAVTDIVESAPTTSLVVIEAPAFSRTTGHQHDRSGLWWLVVDQLLGAGHLVAEVAPTARAKYATGKGNAGKDAVLLAVARRYPGVLVEDNNQADALILRAMGCHRYRQSLADVPQTHAAALDAVQWPNVDLLAGAA
jgi:crossover junction endodeoxyribonuclease RuvC